MGAGHPGKTISFGVGFIQIEKCLARGLVIVVENRRNDPPVQTALARSIHTFDPIKYLDDSGDIFLGKRPSFTNDMIIAGDHGGIVMAGVELAVGPGLGNRKGRCWPPLIAALTPFQGSVDKKA